MLPQQSQLPLLWLVQSPRLRARKIMISKYITTAVATIALVAGLSACQKGEESGLTVVSATGGGTAVAVNTGTIVTGGQPAPDQSNSQAGVQASGDSIVQSSSGHGEPNIIVGGANSSAEVNGDSIVQSSSGRNSANIVILNGRVLTSSEVVKARGPDKTEERAVGTFDAVSLEIASDTVVTLGPKPSVTITCAENILPLVRTDVRGGRLIISIKGSVSMAAPIKVAIVTTSLHRAALTGSGSMRLAGMSGEALELGISGSGTVVADGRVKQVDIDVSGSGHVDAASLRSEEVATMISGSASVKAFATHSATVDLAGSGTVTIAGNPARRSVDRAGSGRVSFE